MNFLSVDWQSLTFVGERHEIDLLVPGPGAAEIVNRLVRAIADTELSIAGQVVADIALANPPTHHDDGSISLNVEALTIVE